MGARKYKSAERLKAEARASQDLVALPATFPIRSEVADVVAHHDRVATECEAKWGVGRLQELVPVDLAQKFRAQQERMYAAMNGGTILDQQRAVAAMTRAWQALDKHATEAGCRQVGEKWFECQTAKGLVAVCEDEATAERATRSGRYTVAVPAQTLAAILDDQPKLVDFLKASPPGRVTIRRRTTTGDPGRPFNDRIPFA